MCAELLPRAQGLPASPGHLAQPEHILTDLPAAYPYLASQFTVDALLPAEKGAATAKQAYKEGRPILDVAREATGMRASELRKYLDPMALTRGGIQAGGGGSAGG